MMCIPETKYITELEFVKINIIKILLLLKITLTKNNAITRCIDKIIDLFETIRDFWHKC